MCSPQDVQSAVRGSPRSPQQSAQSAATHLLQLAGAIALRRCTDWLGANSADTTDPTDAGRDPLAFHDLIIREDFNSHDDVRPLSLTIVDCLPDHSSISGII